MIECLGAKPSSRRMGRIMDRRRLVSVGLWGLAARYQTGSASAQTAAGTGVSEDYAQGDGARLYIVRSGNGPLMVFLHGHPDRCDTRAEISKTCTPSPDIAAGRRWANSGPTTSSGPRMTLIDFVGLEIAPRRR